MQKSTGRMLRLNDHNNNHQQFWHFSTT